MSTTFIKETKRLPDKNRDIPGVTAGYQVTIHHHLRVYELRPGIFNILDYGCITSYLPVTQDIGGDQELRGVAYGKTGLPLSMNSLTNRTATSWALSRSGE